MSASRTSPPLGSFVHGDEVREAFAVSRRQWAVFCPPCGLFHFHGAGEGSRSSHCADRGNPDYYLVHLGRPYTDEMRKQHRAGVRAARARDRAKRREAARRRLRSRW